MPGASTTGSALERGSVQQSAPSTDAGRVPDGLTLPALPGGVTAVAAPGARLMTDQDRARAEPMTARAELGWQDHPPAIGTRHQVAEAAHGCQRRRQPRKMPPVIVARQRGMPRSPRLSTAL